MITAEEQKRIIDNYPYTIAVDIDGCLAKLPTTWRGPLSIEDPIQSTVAKLKERLQANPKLVIIIHTCRVNSFENPGQIDQEMVKNVRNWLTKHNIPFSDIWTGQGKPFAQEYWDDNAVKVVDTSI